MEINKRHKLERNGPALLCHVEHISPLYHGLALLASISKPPFPIYFYVPARLHLSDYGVRHLFRHLFLHRLRAHWLGLSPKPINDLARPYPEGSRHSLLVMGKTSLLLFSLLVRHNLFVTMVVSR